MNWLQQFTGRYGPQMGDEGAGHPRDGSRFPLDYAAGYMNPGGFQAHTGGVMPPQTHPNVSTGGGLPAMAQGFPSNGGPNVGLPYMPGSPSANTGGGMAPQPMNPYANTGGGMQPQPYGQPKANTGGGLPGMMQGLHPQPGQLPPGMGRISFDPAGFFGSSASDRGTRNGRALQMGDGRFNEYRYGPERGDRAY